MPSFRDRRKSDDEKPKQPAKSYVLWLLSRREYSSSQLQDRLMRKGYDEDEISEALKTMQGYGFQDDERFAASKTRNLSRRTGDRGIKSKLFECGIDRNIADAQMENLEPEADRACNLIERFSGKPFDENLRNKAWRYLAARGFSSSSIKSAISHLAEISPPPEDDDSDS